MNSYRQSPFANITPVVKNLLIINVIFFLAFLLIDHEDARGPVTSLFGSFYFDSPQFRPWQLVTYMFMHGGFQHLLFNMLGLFFLGPMLEYFIGSKRFLTFYFICGLGAVFLQLAVQAIEVHNLTGAFTIPFPKDEQACIQATASIPEAIKLFGIYHGPLVGASGALFGISVAFAMIYPDLELMMLFIPVPVKAKYFIPGYILLEVYSGFANNPNDHIAHFAHIGGAIIGFILIKAWKLKGPSNFY